MALTITGIEPESIAEELGLEKGDVLLRMSGEPLKDTIDYLYFSSQEFLTLEIARGEETFTAEIEKDPEEPLGIIFEGDGYGKKRGCRNKCIFCFIDQLPRGMRKTLYFKDDDWRLSFVMGNYITLTNVDEEEFNRILKRKTSPLYISVHATDDDVRARILGTPHGRGILDKLARLKQAGIVFHCQAVLAPGINDGQVLEKTLADLTALYPYAQSLALVPIGLTGHRNGLTPLAPVDRKSAQGILDILERWQKQCIKELGTRFVFGADELYIKAGQPLPPYETYEDFLQLEDGVGLVRKLLFEAEEALQSPKKSRYQAVSLACGTDVAPYLRELAKKCQEKLGVKVMVYEILNRFFGETITVTGLLTGKDVIEQLRGKPLGERLFLSSSMFRDGGDIFLDDTPFSKVEEELGAKTQRVYPDGYELIDAFLGE